MARTQTWSVKGIEHETRALAREAAARSDQPMGAWIDRAIRIRTGLPPDDEPKTRNQGALPGIDAPAAGEPAHAAPARPAVPTARRGGAWYAAGGLIVLALMGGGYLILERQNADRPAPPVAASPPPAAAAAPEKTAAAPARPGPLERLRAEAERNNPAAQYDLGLIYARGETVAKDDKEAARWFERAAKQGLPAAQFNLGLFYEQGRGVARNDSRAFHWYQSAAEQGHARARHNLGTMLVEGKGTPRNYDKAAHWFAKAAEAGVAESFVSLGMLYERGLGRPRDPARALAYYRKAAAQGSKAAEKRIAALAPAAKAARPAPGGAQDVALGTKGIAELQRLLGQLELSPGTADGVLGDKTVAAIRMYQEFAGLPVDGKPTRELLGDLRQVVGAMGGKPVATSARGR